MSAMVQLGSFAAAALADTYAVALSPTTFGGGRRDVLALRGEPAFRAATLLTSIEFKVQTSRTADGAADATDSRWTDLRLYRSHDPAAAPLVEQSVTAQAGKTVGWDVYCELGHRGRDFLRVLAKKTGGAASGADALVLWGSP